MSTDANRGLNQKLKKKKNGMTNSVDLDEMAHYELSHIDLHCLHRLSILVCWAERLKIHSLLHLGPDPLWCN